MIYFIAVTVCKSCYEQPYWFPKTLTNKLLTDNSVDKHKLLLKCGVDSMAAGFLWNFSTFQMKWFSTSMNDPLQKRKSKSITCYTFAARAYGFWKSWEFLIPLTFDTFPSNPFRRGHKSQLYGLPHCLSPALHFSFHFFVYLFSVIRIFKAILEE